MEEDNIKNVLHWFKNSGEKETNSKIWDFIKKEGFITGSYLFYKEDAKDIDVVFPPKCSYSWRDILRDYNGVYGGDYRDNLTQNLYVMYKGKLFNLIFCNTVDEYERWKFATQEIKKFYNQSEENKIFLKDKKIRVELFEKFKDSFNSK